jgi:hypothetical protein
MRILHKTFIFVGNARKSFVYLKYLLLVSRLRVWFHRELIFLSGPLRALRVILILLIVDAQVLLSPLSYICSWLLNFNMSHH